MRRIALAFAALLVAGPAHAGKRVALLIGQDAYPGGKSATIGLPPLANSGNDVRKVAGLLSSHGFEVISCDGKRPGCFDLNRQQLTQALADLKTKAEGADTALLYFAGHGMASAEGNILTPIDAHVNCASGDVTQGVPVEAFMAATAPARHKLVLLDACRNNPLGEVCPSLKGRKLAFTRIEAGDLRGLLLVTSTQFGQEALDGAKGANSPFAASLVAGLAANPRIYFEQVMNEVGRATYAAAQKEDGFQQVPGKIVGTPAPDDCLAGKDCIGDMRMAALAEANEKLTADASAVRNIVADEEKKRGKPYTAEERQAAVERIGRSLTSLAGSAEPKVKEATQLFGAGKVREARAKLDEALDDDEKAAAEIERLAKERRKTLARNARDAARLSVGSDVAKGLVYFERATRNDPEDALTWYDYARAAVDAGKLELAKSAFEQAAAKVRDINDARLGYGATLGLGDVALDQGSLPDARHFYDAAAVMIASLAKADPGNSGWQRDLSVSYDRVADVRVAQGNLPEALKSFRDSLAIRDRLAKADPGNSLWQRDLGVSFIKVGDVLVALGNLPQALKSFRDSHAIFGHLAKADPGNSGWQSDLSVSLEKVGNIRKAQGNLPEALQSFRDSLAIRAELAKADPGNSGWQYDLGIINERIGDVQKAQGDLDAAITSYKRKQEIIDRLAKSDTGNSGWQRDLSVSQEKIGDVLVAQGNLPEALKSFRDSLAIADRLAKADPGNNRWQRDLAVAYIKVGEVLAQGNLPEALKSFRDSLAIADRLAKADPGNSGWQRDLSVAHAKLANAYRSSGEKAKTREHLSAGRAIIAHLVAAHPDWAEWKRDLGWFDGEIADLEGK